MNRNRNGELSGLSVFHGSKGFSLIELMVVLCILSAVAGTVTVTSSLASVKQGTDECVIREAKRFERWLNNRFHKALLYRRSFNFKSLPCSTPASYIQIIWNDTNETEIYNPEGNCYFTVRGSAVKNSTYSPQWHTVSPAFTLKALRSPDDKETVKFIRISLYSNVRVTDDPPED